MCVCVYLVCRSQSEMATGPPCQILRMSRLGDPAPRGRYYDSGAISGGEKERIDIPPPLFIEVNNKMRVWKFGSGHCVF